MEHPLVLELILAFIELIAQNYGSSRGLRGLWDPSDKDKCQDFDLNRFQNATDLKAGLRLFPACLAHRACFDLAI